ncbi:TRAFAC clade GTPase domain-containing protein [Corynebacterium gallinarum]|uniref:Double-GTPase 2 domain-containing protein n=1 Tax=Corynebacterium gallinarum TaxID=2762214 RepID=A0A8I0HQ54_9CORY|nr:hypothetical protein [Corynebacterium gallinarum]MBD8030999.1 hypothetical protein [Corynebacterium gallinarum]
MGLKDLFKKSTVNCPYCYTETSLDDCVYRCAGIPAPGMPACEPQPDEVRERFSDPRRYLPFSVPKNKNGKKATCSYCGGPCFTRLFSCCHSPVPANFSADSTLMGLVGARAAGKTVLLTVLNTEFSNTVGPRFRASIANISDNMNMTDELSQWREQMNQGGGLPGSTNRGKKIPYIYEWRYLDRSKSAIFSFYDTAGESLASVADARDMQYLAATDSLVLLLNPFAFPAVQHKARERGIGDIELVNPEQILINLTQVLQAHERTGKNKKIKKPLAIAVAKMDAFAEEISPNSPLLQESSKEPFLSQEESLRVHNEVGAKIVEWGGGAFLDHLEAYYDNYRLFSLSALGNEPDYATATASQLGVTPIRVAEPFLWLMSLTRFVPTK